MMHFSRITLKGEPHTYCFLHDELDTTWALFQDQLTQRLEQIGSSRFFRLPIGSLCKLSQDRHNPGSLAWLNRDLIERRLLLQASAVKEWRSNKILSRLGIRTIHIQAVALACNPLNPLGSLLVMPLLDNLISGEEHFKVSTEAEREILLQRIAHDIAKAAQHGYTHRDLHLGNLMVAKDGGIIWIDTHLRNLSVTPALRRQQLSDIFHENKLFGPYYKAKLQNLTLEQYDRLVNIR